MIKKNGNSKQMLLWTINTTQIENTFKKNEDNIEQKY